MSIGYIYILSNATMPGLVKIGYTAREDVMERVSELSSATGVPAPFEIEYYCLTRRVEDIEEKAHKEFSSLRSAGKEFFRVDIVEAVRVVDGLVDQEIKPDRYYSARVSRDISPISKWHCGLCKNLWSAKGDVQNCPLCKSESINKIGM